MKTIQKSYLLLFLLSFFSTANLAQSAIYIGDSAVANCISIKVIESNASVYKAKIRVNKIRTINGYINGEMYQRLFFDNSTSLNKIGEPDLPVIIQHIGLPVGTTYNVKITEEKWVEKAVQKIFPAQVDYTNSLCNEICIVDSIYHSRLYQSALMCESDMLKWKGVDNILLTICPFKYHPSTNILSVLAEFTLSVTFYNNHKEESGSPLFISKKELDYFDNKNFLVTINDKDGESLSRSTDYPDYLIIVGNLPQIENSQVMNRFCKWKALKGYKTKVISTSTIGSDSASIKNYIRQQFLLGVKRVLFVGNESDIPLPIVPARVNQVNHEIIKTDYWYGCLDGDNDLQCDLPIARFVTNTISEFTNVVNKTIDYESKYHSWTNNVLLTCHNDIIPNYPNPIFQVPLDTIYNDYHLLMDFTKAFATSPSLGGNSTTITDFINHYNSGMNIVVVNAHGNAGGFWLFNGNNSTLFYCDSGLLDNYIYPVFFSNACYNGDFTETYSIMKDFMRSNHCTSAYVACTAQSFIMPQNEVTKKLFSNLFNYHQYCLGDLVLNSHIGNLGYGNNAIDNAFGTIISGDPTLEIWTGEQLQFGDVDISMSGNGLDIYINNEDDYSVSVVSSDSQLMGSYNSLYGSVSIPLSEGCYDLAINKHNYIPYVVHVDLTNQFIQNVTINENSYYFNSPISIGYDVTTNTTYGNVIIEEGAKVVVNNSNGVLIKNGFECQNGAEFIVE